MRRLAAILIGAVALIMGTAAPSDAKIVIPCTGERLVTVVEIPKDKQPPDETINIGYLFPGCFGEGEWVAVTGGDKFYRMTERMERTLLERAGLKELPPTPNRLDYPFQALLVETITVGVIILYALFALLKHLWTRRSASRTDATVK